jgi:hypothetical protein
MFLVPFAESEKLENTHRFRVTTEKVLVDFMLAVHVLIILVLVGRESTSCEALSYSCYGGKRGEVVVSICARGRR